ncbi:erythromycin esterase family protein, partial [Rhizobium sp. YIM 134829]|uniref:erythromycin esterase family protein n=1 Tax=Rhizobium sp. YIM 134829 TaxID=3390453 RepID=UPI00397B0782
HSLGELQANRRLIEWLHDFNLSRPGPERVTVHGFDAPTEFTSAPSPRPYLQRAIDYLDADIDIDDLVGDDQQWSRSEAVMDAGLSPGAAAEADALRAIAHDLLISLHARAPQLIAATSHDAWRSVRVHLTAVLGLLAYHKQAAQQVDETARLSGLLATRDAIMARNLIDIRAEEGRRGATIVYAHNRHLQRERSQWTLGDMNLVWNSAGAIIDSVIGPRYTFVAGSLGTSSELGLQEPPPDTYEALLGHATGGEHESSGWGLVPASTLVSGYSRTDVTPAQGYFPLDELTLQSADWILHISDAVTAVRRGDAVSERNGAQ